MYVPVQLPGVMLDLEVKSPTSGPVVLPGCRSLEAAEGMCGLYVTITVGYRGRDGSICMPAPRVAFPINSPNSCAPAS